LIALAVSQRFDFSNSYAVFDTHPTGESLHSLAPPLKRLGKARLAQTLDEQR